MVGVGLVVLAVGTLIGSLFFGLGGAGDDASGPPRETSLLADADDSGTEDLEDYDIQVKELEDAVKGFLAADSIEEMTRWVRDRKRVMPLIKEYYGRDGQEFRPLRWKAIGEDQGVSVLGEMRAVLVTLDDYSQRQIGLEKTTRGFRVDWESWVGYSEMSWEEFQERRPTRPIVFRVRMERGDYYNFGFTDETRWLCFRILSPDDDLLWGYAEAESAAVELRTMHVGEEELLMTVRLRFPENSTRGDQVIVDELVATGWVIHEGVVMDGR
jgi:hypothetical protein